MVAGTDMNVSGRQCIIQLRCDGISLGNLLGFEPFSFQHVEKIGIAAEIQLICSLQFHAAFPEQMGQDAVDNGSPDLGFDVVSDNR